MRFEVTHSYPAGPARVAAMLSDEDYLRSSARASGSVATRTEVTHTEEGSFVITGTRRLPTDTIPPSLRSFVGSTIELKMVQAWSGPDEDQGRTATVTMDITGTPARCTARTRLSGSEQAGAEHASASPANPDQAGAGQTTEIEYIGEVSVPIPLVGPAVEQAVVDALHKALDAEHQAALDYLSVTDQQ